MNRGNPLAQPAAELAAIYLYRRHIAPLHQAGLRQAEIAEVLNLFYVPAIRGGHWHQCTVSKLLNKVQK